MIIKLVQPFAPDKFSYFRTDDFLERQKTCLPAIRDTGQHEISDSLKTIRLQEVVVTAYRLPVLLKSNPGSISMVTSEVLSVMPGSASAEEALRLNTGSADR